MDFIRFFKNKKAQGAMEYLLIIGGAILIAAIVLSVLVATAKKASKTTDKTIDDFNKKISDINTENILGE